MTAEQTLRLFVKGLSGRKGIEKNLWAKKFIKSIKYCKEEIAVSFYYKSGSEEVKDLYPASGRVGAAASRSTVSLADKKITPISTDRGNYQEWLRLANDIRSFFKGTLEEPVIARPLSTPAVEERGLPRNRGGGKKAEAISKS
jgi:hypothetical protein